MARRTLRVVAVPRVTATRTAAVLAVLLSAALACGASPAFALSPPAQKLAAIVKADGRSAKASPIVRPGGIATALVFYSLNVTVSGGYVVADSHSIADVYRYIHGRWHRVGHIDFGKDSLGSDTQAPPRSAALTGATDFVVSFEAAGAAPISVVSDTGGHWHVVPFVAPGQAPENAVEDGQVSGDTVISYTQNCIPSCATGTSTKTTWHYDAAAQAFEPYTPPTGPCSDQTLTSGDVQAIGCFVGPTSGVYTTTQTFKLNGLQFSPDPGTTLTFVPSLQTTAVTASGPGCLQTMVTAIIDLGEFDLKCWKRSATISFANNKLVLTSLDASSPAGNFFGLPFVYAAITLQSGYTASIQGSVGLAPLFGNPLLSASFSAATSNDHGLSVEQMCASFNPSTIGNSVPLSFKGLIIPLRSANLCFSPASQELSGTASVALPGLDSPTIKAGLAFHVGSLPAPGSVTIPGTSVNVSFAGLEIGLSGINEPIFPYIFLQQLAGGLSIYPHLELEAYDIGLSLGPQVGVLNHNLVLMEAVGSATITFGGDDGFSDFFFSNN
ncbi:MAG TPA: hypothetical protein VMD48_05220, partial [Solirubrobacteraceae bacterium]|nr:hypothetical protein [Solirubrobacteraceae bacterium]